MIIMASALPTFTKIGKVIRLNRHGCTNRPFYHIVVQKTTDNQDGPVIEQVGSFDAMPNNKNEKLVALNFERIQYWLSQGAGLSDPVAQLLGLSGFLPNHPRTLIQAWKNRREPPRERKIEAIKGIAPPLDNPKI
uniref:Small ribosomal subunit protein bS16m n=1 Tax=Daphnia similis TaxID=35528 RepID=A0A4Y7LSG2_9CRUS|nr:EOG090X0KAD [Daphnia similis]SVE71453.1 EOG090X0KAD [Daphnia similis]SVE72086.1 EOG090X0KAD [Daphnia similis]SVE72713.1 EOG090X0KAD [Daphnia similis]